MRHDGGHKRDRYVTDVLGEYFAFVPYCPEMAIGLGTPRRAIHLVSRDGAVRLVEVKDESVDYTDRMHSAADGYCDRLAEISGYILKSKSPSCGMERVNLFPPNGHPLKEGVGLFAARLMQRFPCLPVEEEGRLHDPNIRENFIERVFAYDRWLKLRRGGLTVAGLQAFHRAHKFVLLAHDQGRYRQLGRLVAETRADNLDSQADAYIAEFSTAMRKHASKKKHVNVLEHLMGYLKTQLDTEDKRELLEIFDKYKAGEVPLVVPITLLRHHFRRHPHAYVREQLYLAPYPEELMLRNHV